MFTPDFRPKAQAAGSVPGHLALAYALFEVPEVHRSVSANGGGDLDFSKPRFIAAMLARFAKPVLYVDSDVVFRSSRACSLNCARKSAILRFTTG